MSTDSTATTPTADDFPGLFADVVTIPRESLRLVLGLAYREAGGRTDAAPRSPLGRALAIADAARRAPSPVPAPARCDVHDSERHRAPCQEWNGHANRETFVTSLMLENDAETDSYVWRIARAAYDAATVAEGLSSDHLPNVRRAAVADALEGFADDLVDIALGETDALRAPFDMATARAWVREVGSLWRVEWRDLARHYVATLDAEGEDAARA